MYRTDSSEADEEDDLFPIEVTGEVARKARRTVAFQIGNDEDDDNNDEVDFGNGVLESDEENSDSRDHYPMGLCGSTPPRNERYIRQGKKHKPSLRKMSPGPVTVREKRQVMMAKNRVQSALLDTSTEEDPQQASQERRHTWASVPAYAPGATAMATSLSPQNSEEDLSKRSKKKKHTVIRNKERYEKCQLKSPPSDSAKLSPSPISIKKPRLKDMSDHSFSIDSLSGPLPAYSDDLLTSSLNPSTLKFVCGSPPQKIERSKSDAQLSLALHSGHTMHCPSERKQFYRRFTKALKVYSMRQSAQLLHILKQRSEDLSVDNPMGPVMERIWVELKANLDGCLPSAIEEFQIYRRWEVDEVLDQIIHFRFEASQSEMPDGAFLSVDRDDYEVLSSLPSETTTNPWIQLPSVTEQPIEEENEEQEEGEQPATLTQQDSADSDFSGRRHQEECCEGQFLVSRQKLALVEVRQLLRKLEQVEVHYCSSRKMGDENAKYRTSQFKRRLDALVLWCKITEGLANHLCRLSKWVGVTIKPPYEVQLSGDQTSSPSPSQMVSRSSTNGGSSLLKKLLFAQSSVSASSDASNQNPEESLLLTQSSVISSSSSRSQTTLQRLFSRQNPSSLDEMEAMTGYSKFVDRTLKKKGLKWVVQELDQFSCHILGMAELAMASQSNDSNSEGEEDEEDDCGEERKPLLHIYKPQLAAPLRRSSSTSPLCWMDEFSAMNLPSFSQLVYIHVYLREISLHRDVFFAGVVGEKKCMML